MLARLFGGAGAGGLGSPSSGADAGEGEEVRTRHAVARGALYTTGKSGAGQQCVYLSCEAVVRGTGEAWRRELLVSNLEEDGGEGWPLDIAFGVDSSMRLDVDGLRFGWSDRGGRRYNFDCDTEEGAAGLRSELLRGMWELRNQRGADGATEEELERFLVGNLGRDSVGNKPSDLLQAAGELIRSAGDFYKYDAEKECFFPMAQEVTATLNSATVKEDGSRAYLLMVFNEEGKKIFEQEVDNDMDAQFFSSELSMVWVVTTGNKEVVDPKDLICLSVKLKSAQNFVRFRNQFAVCLYEVSHEGEFEDLNEQDRRYVEDSVRDDVEPMDVDSEEEEEEERILGEARESRRDSMAEDSDAEENSQLAVAYKNDRSFVVRGSKMGIFKTGEDDLDFRHTIRVKDPSQPGKYIKPSKILLHEQDTSMLLLDPNDETRVMRMDLNRGEVVETWKGSANQAIKTVHRAEKYSNLTPMKEFVGLNKNQLMRMDPRTPEFVVLSKRYAAGTRARFQTLATTGVGHIAVASENGDIRLYDTIGKNAKTLLPGLGDPIIGIDVTEDGHFVLATTRKYLLVINTRVKGQAKGGFLKSMGKNKPAPVKLTISAVDVVRYRMGKVEFTPAHFNTGASLERSIVTSTGPFIVTWNFRAVKLGRLDSYQVRRYRDNIVADEFTYNDDGKIVVTLPNDVTLNGLNYRRRG